MSETVEKNHEILPAKADGRSLIYAKSEMVNFEKVNHGNESDIYEAILTDESGVDHLLIVKKFKDKNPNCPDEKHQVDRCKFTSGTADLFRKEGLPVLPLVKSITTKKDIRSHALHLVEEFVEKRNIEPPFVLMTKVVGKKNIDGKHHVDFIELLNELRCKPKLLEDMVKDLAHIHRLGFVMDEYSKGGLKHPISTLWLFSEDKKGEVERYLADLTNLKKNNNPKDFESSRMEDLTCLLALFRVKNDVGEQESKYKQIYETTYKGV